MGGLKKGIQAVDILVIHLLQRQIVLAVLGADIFGHIPQQPMVFVGRYLADAHADLSLFLVAVFGELGKQLSRPLRRVGHALFDGEARRLFALFDKLVIGRENVCAVGRYNAVDLFVDCILPQGAFEALIPMLRFDLTLGVNLRCLPAQLDAGIDRSFALAGYFGFLAEENHAEKVSFHSAVNLSINNTFTA